MLDEHADLWHSQDIPHASRNKFKHNESRRHPISDRAAARTRDGTDVRHGVRKSSYQRKHVEASRSAGLTGPAGIPLRSACTRTQFRLKIVVQTQARRKSAAKSHLRSSGRIVPEPDKYWTSTPYVRLRRLSGVRTASGVADDFSLKVELEIGPSRLIPVKQNPGLQL